jgi:hypothetical protein
MFDAAEALSGRLVSRVLPDDELLPAAPALAAEIAENTSAVAVALARQLMWSMLGTATPWQAHRLDSLAMFRLGQSADVVEGVTSFWRNAGRSSPAGSLILPVSSRCGRSGRRPWPERHWLSPPRPRRSAQGSCWCRSEVSDLEFGQHRL